QKRLPEYMVPGAFVTLAELPLTGNGKLDRKALPLPEWQAYSACSYVAPIGETEELLAAIWADVLRVERVDRNHNFFELGGHSLLAMRMLSRLREALQIEVPLAELFARPRLAEFAQGLVTAARSPLPPITRVGRSINLELSFAQQRLWFLAQMKGVSQAYHVPLNLSLKGKLDREALGRALDRIVERHEVLRTTFAMLDGEPVQRIAEPKDSHFHLLEEKLEQDGDQDRKLEQLIAEEKNTAFDLARGPLIRGRLIRLAEDEHVLLLTMHHIVSDAWSMEVLFHELNELYSALVCGQPDPLPPLPVQYADYAIWQRRWMQSDMLRGEEEYWKRTLQNAPPVLELPGDYVRPAEKDYLGSVARVVLEEKFTARLKELSRRHGTTLYITLLAGWAALLARLSGNRDVVVGAPIANRGLPELEKLIGFFVNTLALRLDISGEPAVGKLLKKVEAQALAGQQHRNIPFERVVELVRPDRSLAHTPLFQVMFAWESASAAKLALPGLEIRQLEGTFPPGAKFDLTLMLKEDEGRITGGIEYATSLFEHSTVERYAQYLRRMLEGMVSEETTAVERLPILSETEHSQLVYEWNSTAAAYPSGQCVHHLFEEQAERMPEQVAVIDGEQQLTYGELNRRSNRL
ncbi:MAG TPA: condensation domain-containing protein, partial [Candidatus Angelobacter sp.]|nr:condensation domain-containing protein [Candidatus Angelobacter sp.]